MKIPTKSVVAGYNSRTVVACCGWELIATDSDGQRDDHLNFASAVGGAML